MGETITGILLIVAAIYLIAGLLFAIPFVISGVNKMDEGAHGSSIGFRIIIIPGVIVFWPVLLKKWMRHGRQKDDAPKYSFAIKPLRKKHLLAWQTLALLLPLLIIAAVVVRPSFPKEKLLQPVTIKALPLILKQADKENYTVSIRSNSDTTQLQLEWINKKVLTYPTATIYKTFSSQSEEGVLKEVQSGKADLIGRIEARGNYYFDLAKDSAAIEQYMSSAVEFVLYDFIHQQIIDTIKL